MYRISEKAIADLEEIWIYTFKNWSFEQADRYYHSIISEIEFIANNPSLGKSMGHVKEGYRASEVKSHLIFYKTGIDNIVEVVRILYQRMDIENRLND
ncbi:MAG TPA: type II toxin-antitoxin system RelE/ParE family toxin [Balneolaceae bacterium]